MTQASDVIAALGEANSTIAAGESLTGGLVVATLVGVSGASAVVSGAIVAYSAELKISLLGVDRQLIEAEGTVHHEVATQMAVGARARCGTTYGVATTGVAGPSQVDGHPVGTVFIAIAGPHTVEHRQLSLAGDRAQIRNSTVAALLSLVSATLGSDSSGKNL